MFANLPDSRIRRLCVDADAFAACHGVLMQRQGRLETPALALVPAPVPGEEFEGAVRMFKIWNSLTDKLSRHPTFLSETLHSVASSDSFTRRLLQIYQHVQSLPYHQKQEMTLGILRSDYMLSAQQRFKQVELNTVSCAFGALSSAMTDLHRFIHRGVVTSMALLPHNVAFERITFALATAVIYVDLPFATRTSIDKAAFEEHLFRVRDGKRSCKKVLLMVVQSGEANSFDQRALEFELFKTFSINTIRYSLLELSKEATVDDSTGDLVVGEFVVGCVYFRAGYGPGDYGDADDSPEWQVRALIEQSAAVKCPSVAYQLFGSKKVQQVLTIPSVLDSHVGTELGDTLRQVFVKQWSLDANDSSQEGVDKVVREAIGNSHLYVLKPQREGGGNNFYGAEMQKKLSSMSRDEMKAFVLMERIVPPEHPSVFLRDGNPIKVKAVSEFGFYSIYLGDGHRTLLNEPAGHLVRTKQVGVDEGGVASGYAVLDSPFRIS